MMSMNAQFQRSSGLISSVNQAFALGVGIVCTFFVLTSTVEAFKLKTHLIIANEAIKSINGSHVDATINIRNIGQIKIHNAEIVNAVKNFPSYYRAGTFGPDVYPDLVAGQQYVHVNKGKEEGLTGCRPTLGDGVPLEKRKFCQWRSIDNGMHVLARANEYHGTTGASEKWRKKERGQALAFAYGYLTHMIGDSFAHGYVNEWVKSSFDLFKGHEGALYGPPTEEVQHYVLEGYLDAHMPPTTDMDLYITTPRKFLTKLFTERVVEKGGLTDPGAFGGVFFRELIRFRGYYDTLAHVDRWTNGILGDKVHDVALKIHAKKSQLLSLGTEIGNPIRDIEDYFMRRREMIDMVISSWVEVSGCVAQNIVFGASRGSGEILEKDNCKFVNPERRPLIKDIFQGKLKEAVHYGAGKFEFDYGRITNNIKKQTLFIEEVLKRGLIPELSEDIQSIRKLKRWVQKCEPIVKWGTCEKACSKTRRTCTKVVKKAGCAGCPKHDGKYNCGGKCKSPRKWCLKKMARAARCVTAPHCLACAKAGGALTKIVTDPVCTATVNSALPACEFCSQNTVCTHLKYPFEIHENLEKFLTLVIEEALAKAADRAKREILKVYAGPYINDFLALYHEMERRGKRQKRAWYVNIAFMKEDFQTDPEFLNLVLQRMSDLPGPLLSNATSVAEATAYTVKKTNSVAIKVLETYIEVKSGKVYKEVWEGIINILYRIAKEQNFNAFKDLESDTYDWFDEFSFKSDKSDYDSRFAKFVRLMGSLEGLSSLRGPTARMLRAEWKLSDSVEDDGTGSINVRDFHSTNNALELTKLGFLGKKGIMKLGFAAGLKKNKDKALGFAQMFQGAVNKEHQVSDACIKTPHIVCDAISSLDDPNNYVDSLDDSTNYSNGILNGTDVGNQLKMIDVKRSVEPWGPRKDAHESRECRLGLTNFLLSANSRVYEKVYKKIFMLPEYCN